MKNESVNGEGSEAPTVLELRLVVTAPDYDEALSFYRDTLGLAERASCAAAGVA
jgi:hypothetical protein